MSITMNLPFEGEWFVINGGQTLETNHHHHALAQRYALDLVMIDARKRSFTGKGDSNHNYYCFGKRVVAPAPGVIAEAVDGVTDNQPDKGNYLAGAGNYVVIDHGDNIFSMLAHFKLGSTAVKVGDKVQPGQLIAHCGNSGTSFAPHLHFHIQKGFVQVKYEMTFDPNDATYGNFFSSAKQIELAEGILPVFDCLTVNGSVRHRYSPTRGDLVSK